MTKKAIVKLLLGVLLLFYRTAIEVHWDAEGQFLYSPKPREWTCFDWYKQIIEVAKYECNCELILNGTDCMGKYC